MDEIVRVPPGKQTTVISGIRVVPRLGKGNPGRALEVGGAQLI